jgi:predicted nucleic acid-binding Zn finger protein
MQVINIKKKFLKENGYNNFEEWKKIDNHLYIGRNMDFYVKGTFASKWKNPYSIKKYGLDKCLELYELYIRKSSLYNDLDELDNKILGCWCKPNKCHGDILIKLLKEKKIDILNA